MAFDLRLNLSENTLHCLPIYVSVNSQLLFVGKDLRLSLVNFTLSQNRSTPSSHKIYTKCLDIYVCLKPKIPYLFEFIRLFKRSRTLYTGKPYYVINRKLSYLSFLLKRNLDHFASNFNITPFLYF